MPRGEKKESTKVEGRSRSRSRGRGSPKKKTPAKSRSRSRGRSKTPTRKAAVKSPKTEKSPARKTATPRRARSKTPTRKSALATPRRSVREVASSETSLPEKTTVHERSSPEKTVTRVESLVTTAGGGDATSNITTKTFKSTVVESSSSSSVTSAAVVAAAAAATAATASITPSSFGAVRRSDRLALKREASQEEEGAMAGVDKKEKAASGNKAAHTEFGGPLGAFCLLFLLPISVYVINMACTKGQCSITKLPAFPPKKWRTWLDVRALGVVLGWFVFQALLAVLPVGKVVKGLPLKGGKTLEYRCNGVYAFWISVITFVVAWHQRFPVVEFVLRNYWQLMTSATLLSVVLSVYLYVRARRAGASALAPTATGNVFSDFFLGRELNPRWGDFDLKFFFELRPGLIGWVVLDLAFMLQRLDRDNLFSVPQNLPLVLITLCHAWYVYDALVHEPAILSTMDITTDGFGFMLVFGDIVWVPFLYSLTARYAFRFAPQISLPYMAFAACLHLVGFAVFRGSNSQKDAFRQNPYDPRFANLSSVSTGSGKKRLLAGGWWGLCRKPNYLGDLLMALSWSLFCGCGNAIPYFYPIYMLVLLVHRASRDDAACRAKYGRHWDTYCSQVRSRIVPYIY